MLTAVLLIVFAVGFFCMMVSGIFWINAWASKSKSDFVSNLRRSFRFLSYAVLSGLSLAALGIVFGEPSNETQDLLSQISIFN